jgi:excisionase family DNA binding protein
MLISCSRLNNKATMADITKQYLTTSQVAKQYNVDLRTVSRWIRSGLFPNAVKAHEGLRAPYLIPLADVEAFQRPKLGPHPKK